MREFLFYLLILTALDACGATLVIPSVSGPLTIDGSVDEELWKKAAVLPGESSRFGAAFPSGGETRVAVRGGYLCVSARLPDRGRIVAKSTGQNASWLAEDRITWTVHFRAFATSLSVTVNPLGAFRIETSRLPNVRKENIVAAASVSKGGWSAEAAIPIGEIANIGFLAAERVRVARPDAPELHWSWPGLNRRHEFELHAGDSSLPPPKLVKKDWDAPLLQQSERSIASNDALSSAIAAIPGNVEPVSDGVTTLARMWEKNLRSRVKQAALSERREWEKVHSLHDWERFRDQRINALKASLGTFPARTPLRASVTRTLDYGEGFVIENVLFESRPGLVVAANLYRPSRPAGRIPAIIVVHSHHAPKTQWELQDMGMTMARAGTAVLIMDQLGAGERLQSQPWPRESYYSRYALGMQLYLAGESLMKWIVWDLMRSIDLMIAQPYVDPNRIIMLGAVAGGGDPAAVTSAIDPRIAAVIPFNFGEASPEGHYITGPRRYDRETADPGWGEWESSRSLRGSIAGQFFPWLICASVAPRGFIFSFEIGWPHGVEKEPIWARYNKVFELYGRKDRLAQVDGFGPFTGPGEVTAIGAHLREKIYPILKHWNNVPVPTQEFHNPRPEEDLMCLNPMEAAKRKPKTASEIAFRIAQERLSAARAKRAGLSAAQQGAELRIDLSVRLGGDIEPPSRPDAEVRWTKTDSRFTAEGIIVTSEPGIQIPIVLLRPKGASSATRTPIVIGVSQQGKARVLTERREEIAALLEQGAAVCLLDVRGVGESARDGRQSSASAALPGTHLMLGDTALGARLKDVRAVLRYLAAREDLDAKKTVLWGDSTAKLNQHEDFLDQSVLQQPGPATMYIAEPMGGLLAMLSGLYEQDIRAVVATRSLISYASVLKDRFAYVSQDAIVPGILESADISDIIAALGARGVRIEGAVDGRNRAMARADMQRELGLSSMTSRVVVEDPGGRGTVDWIAAQWSK
jgi:dienelactone hydrolase